MMHEILSTGIDGLDKILNGGLIKGHTYLIGGSTGCGKTIFSIQWLLHGVEHNEKCLYVSLAEPAEQLQANVNCFGWNVEKIEVLDLSPQSMPETHEQYHVFSPFEVELSESWNAIYKAVEDYQPQRLVIDSITFLGYLSTGHFQFRKQILAFNNYLKTKQCTSFLIYEPEEMARDVSLALSVDGVIMLQKFLSKSKVLEIRTVEVQKMRGRSYLTGLHPMRITSKGIMICPHIIENVVISEMTDNIIPSGIEQLDLILNDGIEEGTVTLITGPTGVGKSILSIHFALQAARMNIKSKIYSFEEPVDYILKRIEKLKMHYMPFLQNNTFQLRHINPLDLYPDEFLNLLRNDVNEGVRFVVLDSIRGYDIAMEQFGDMDAHIQNMVNFLRSHKVTTIYLNELENLSSPSLQLTQFGISYIVDNIILLRYAEIQGNIVRILGCIKKRLSNFKPDIYEYFIEEGGIRIKEEHKACIGLFSGVSK